MSIGDLVAKLFADPLVGNAVKGVLVLGLVELVTGISRAVSSSTFSLAYVDVWVRTQLAGRILPIVFTLIFAQAVGSVSIGPVDLNILAITGMGAAAVYAAAAVKSIADNLNPAKTDSVPTE